MDVLRLDGDPVSWELDQVDAAALVDDFVRRREPLVVPVRSPLRGRLLLSPRAGAVAFLTERPPQTGWIPSYVKPATPRLHLPAATGSVGDGGPHGYGLPVDTDLDALERALLDAMRGGGAVAVPVSDASGSGTLVLDGAGLRAVVLCPAGEPGVGAPGAAQPVERTARG